MKISDQEQRVLISLHLQGFVNWGAMKKGKRLQLLHGLTDKGLLDQNCRLTEWGIKAGNLSKSKGHICFSDDLRFEYFNRSGDIMRSEIDSPVMPDGYRCGRYFHRYSYYENYMETMEQKMNQGHA